MLKNIILCCLIGLLTTACLGSKAQMGGAGGAAGGALLGQIIGGDTESTLLGAAIGGVLGYVVGNEMDKIDLQRLENVYETSPSFKTTEWLNPDTGNQYAVTPKPARKDQRTGQYCRTAEIEAIIDGRVEITEAVACRNAQGRWVLRQ